MYVERIDNNVLKEVLIAAALSVDQPVVVIFLAENDSEFVPDIIKICQQLELPLIGAVFPALIYANHQVSNGAVVNVFPSLCAPAMVTGLDQESFILPELPIIHAGHSRPTTLVLMDALAENNTALLTGLYNQLGNSCHFLGGGSGYSDLKHRPCIFSEDGFLENAAVIVLLSLASQIGVRHGWRRLNDEPIIVSASTRNTVHQLNWESAFDVYHDVLNEHGCASGLKDNFFQASSGFPLGLYREGQEDVVRDPVAMGEDGSIRFVSSIPENSVVYLLHGDTESLIAAAAAAVDDCSKQNKEAKHCLVMDCLSRSLVMAEDFERELAAVQQRLKEHGHHCIPEGAVTLGEISSYGDGYLESFNKTCVIGLLHE